MSHGRRSVGAVAALRDCVLDRQVRDRNLAGKHRQPAVGPATLKRVVVALDGDGHATRDIDRVNAGWLVRLTFGDVGGDVDGVGTCGDTAIEALNDVVPPRRAKPCYCLGFVACNGILLIWRRELPIAMNTRV